MKLQYPNISHHIFRAGLSNIIITTNVGEKLLIIYWTKRCQFIFTKPVAKQRCTGMKLC